MRNLIVVALLGLFTLPLHAAADEHDPDVLAVLYYADWCGSCKVLDPTIEKARGQFDLDNQPVLFVKLDLTDATSRYQSGLLASALGLGEQYQSNAGKTGYLLLVNAKTGEPIERLTRTASAADISASVSKAIAATAG